MYPNEYILFLVHFHGDRDYFECHEILEDYWKQVDKANKQSIWVAFILLAVSCYHFRRGNYAGALKTIRKSLYIFQIENENISKYGLNKDKLFFSIEALEKQIGQLSAFPGFSLPIDDKQLEEICKNKAAELGLLWKDQTPVDPIFINRHLTRDRTTVLKERAEALFMRQQKK
ncbi:DUF309 domain-containing protein [Niallia sp. NCCP-28]|uniref:DUF309 domain-containing protein n=1 Tax=Niallia sp. NCCP-28 TaxID=2934712 RepID=UPI00208BF2EB|nr:DUF309 domain-containing protein [Niallia sp. NCCP-28]GKU81067.1 hypothetical protein NCCP28_04630 [Niallia sp. NCCP-28]